MIRFESLTLELVKPAPGFRVCAVGDWVPFCVPFCVQCWVPFCV